MTKHDRIILLRLVAYTGMYVPVQDENNIVSFMIGYETGSQNCQFFESFKQFIADKFKIKPGATHWPGQIELLSKKRKQSWLQTFKQTTLDFITEEDSDELIEELNKTFKVRIKNLIDRINIKGDPGFKDSWSEEWKSLCAINSNWFKQLWTPEELKIIQSINNAVLSNKIFSDMENKLPTAELISLKEQYSQH